MLSIGCCLILILLISDQYIYILRPFIGLLFSLPLLLLPSFLPLHLIFCHIYSLESGLDRNTECWHPIGQWVYKGYITNKFSSVLLLTPWWKDPSKMISKDAKKIAKMICLKRLGGKQIYVNNWVLLHFNPMSSNFRALYRYFSAFCTSWSSHNKCLHCSCVLF